MNIRNVIQLEQVPFLSGSDHSRTNIVFHPKEIIDLGTDVKVSVNLVLNRDNLE